VIGRTISHDQIPEKLGRVRNYPASVPRRVGDNARLVQEAKAAAALNHPNICTIHGIVRRDIKPENIMLRKDGICQIMDFGLAKLPSATSTINRLTKEGSTVGTAGSMSPEQVLGQDVDHRSDIFSHCLEKDPKERCQSVAEVARDLRRVKRESTRQRHSRITAARPATGNLGIFIDDGHGNSLVVDGSGKPADLLDANIQGMEGPIRDIWPDSAVREITFLYSACGCPVKVMAKRRGNRIVRTEELPVIFPDDPAVVKVINRLMKW
jgi:hypothetical protein